MHRYLKLAGVLAMGAGIAGCDEFLTGPGLTENPNSPITSSNDQLFIAIQARQYVSQEGQLARLSAIWTQQITGIFNQQLEWGTKYLVTENDIQGHYGGFYIGGGLLDMRKIQNDPAADVRLVNIIKVWEAFTMGTAASLWGDIPYREAVTPTIPTPVLDPQQQVYADVQTVLDQAIAALAPLPAASVPTDLTYGGNAQRWVRAAYTLKARYHLHVAPRVGAAAYTAAIAAANQGINEAPGSVANAVNGQGPGDWRSFHGNTLDDANIWSQFLAARADIAANARLINVLNARGNDPRLAGYFDVASDGQYRGANQWGQGPGPWSLVDATNRTPRPFRQPFVTWTENQLILAEAYFQTGNPAQALIHLNNVRTSLGMPVLGVPIDLEQIMVEKWIAQFQNVDAYSDYRRTCYPRLVPGGPTLNVSAAQIPGRVPYGGNERLQNPNIPPPSQQPARNWNFATTTCPTTGGTL